MNVDSKLLTFDCESIGLHGETFAVGYVITHQGKEYESGYAFCSTALAQGDPSDREWVQKNVNLTGAHELMSPRELRDWFWNVLETHPDATVCAEVPFPVESNFLTAIAQDNMQDRKWEMPYPLIDIASVRATVGFDPLATEERLPSEQPTHSAKADARQSARLLREALIIADRFCQC